MIKLILTDMDGTLLNDHDEINEEFWTIERQLSNEGVVFAIASGRPYYNLVRKFDRIKDNLLFICENGSLVMYKDREIFSNPMTQEQIDKVLLLTKEIKNIVPIFCGKSSSYIDKKIFDNSGTEMQTEIRKYYTTLALVENIKDIPEEIIKVAICDFGISEENSYNYFKDYTDIFNVVVSGKVWLDLSNPGTNKGVAVKKTQESLGITYDETMAFGDYLNDYEMMKNAKYSYAMKNAHPELIAISNFITRDDNNNHGVTNTIKEVFNIK